MRRQTHMKARPKLQIALDQPHIDALQQRANDMGFTSAAALVRWLAVTEITRPQEEPLLNRESRLAIRYLELVLAFRSPPVSSFQQALRHLSLALRSQYYRETLDRITDNYIKP